MRSEGWSEATAPYRPPLYLTTLSALASLAPINLIFFAIRFAHRRRENREKNKTRNIINRNCGCPTGRTANFFDIDLLMDVGAHQNLVQLPLNEGDLILYLMPGDASMESEGIGDKFVAKDVPEVFSLFDDFSYDLSNLDLNNFRQNAMAMEMRQ